MPLHINTDAEIVIEARDVIAVRQDGVVEVWSKDWCTFHGCLPVDTSAAGVMRYMRLCVRRRTRRAAAAIVLIFAASLPAPFSYSSNGYLGRILTQVTTHT